MGVFYLEVFIVQNVFWSNCVQTLSVYLPFENQYLLMRVTLSEFMVLVQTAGL